MYDPQKVILQAFYAALTSPALTYNDGTLPVYTTVPTGQDEYVLISQPTLTQGSGSTACVAWDATLLLSIYTRFEQAGTVSLEPSLDLSDAILSQLLQQRLNLGSFSMSPVEISLASTTQTSDDMAVYVQRNIRLRFSVYAAS